MALAKMPNMSEEREVGNMPGISWRTVKGGDRREMNV
jgi:hypothetical protein